MAVRRKTWQDALDAQMGVWRFTRSRAGIDWLVEAFETATAGLNQDTTDMMLRLFGSEADRLLVGDPIFVSADMCQMVEVASETFQPEPLMPSDLITPCGFAYFETPFELVDRWGDPTTLAALAWAPVISARNIEEFKDEQNKNVTNAELLKWLLEREGNRPQDVAPDGLAMTLYRTPPLGCPSPVLHLHTTPWWFGMTFDGNEVDELGRPTGADQWWKIIQTTFRLMQERISVGHYMRPARAQRREARRLRWDEEREVLVIRLRRESSDEVSEPSGEKANYSHRFIRVGHWRNQWHPSLQAHRQRWIHQTVVGDPSLPLIVKRRAYKWDR